MNHVLGHNIRELRKKKGLTVSQLADRMLAYGMVKPSQNLVSAWERGERTISAENLWYISVALDTTMDALAASDTGKPQHINLQLRRMSINEQAIVRYGTSQWTGDIHSLLRANGMYMQLPPILRCDMVTLLASLWQIANKNGMLNDVPYDVSVQQIRQKMQKLLTQR